MVILSYFSNTCFEEEEEGGGEGEEEEDEEKEGRREKTSNMDEMKVYSSFSRTKLSWG